MNNAIQIRELEQRSKLSISNLTMNVELEGRIARVGSTFLTYNYWKGNWNLGRDFIKCVTKMPVNWHFGGALVEIAVPLQPSIGPPLIGVILIGQHQGMADV